MNNFIDLGIAVLALIGIIIGWRKGFIKMVFKVLAVVLATVVTIALLPTAVDAVNNNTGLPGTFDGWAEGIVEGIAGDNPLLTQPLAEINADTVLTALGMGEWPEQIKAPIQQNLDTVIEAAQQNTGDVQDMKEFLVSNIGNLILHAIVVVLLWVVSCLIFVLIGKILDKFFKLPILRTLNGLLGGVLGLALTGVLVMFLVTIARIVLPIANVSSGYLEQSTIVQQMEPINFFNGVFANMLDQSE